MSERDEALGRKFYDASWGPDGSSWPLLSKDHQQRYIDRAITFERAVMNNRHLMKEPAVPDDLSKRASEALISWEMGYKMVLHMQDAFLSQDLSDKLAIAVDYMAIPVLSLLRELAGENDL